MKQTRLLMGMPVTLEVVDPGGNAEPAAQSLFDEVYAYFEYVDEKFSTYKMFSEISLVNQGAMTLEETSHDMRTVFALAEQFRQETDGYFDVRHPDGRSGGYDPSGLVKGWAIYNAAEIIRQKGFANFYVEAGGDFQVSGKNSQGENWRMGIRSPFNPSEIVKVLSISDRGVATSGTYVRGQHIYNPKGPTTDPEIVSLTIIGPDILEADCYATAAFAMGRAGINFIERLESFEGYLIDTQRMATYTSGFMRYVLQ